MSHPQCASQASAEPEGTLSKRETLLLMHPDKEKKPFWRSVGLTLLRHVSFVGPGLIASVAYCDPGNWATDMEAGSTFGYKLLFTVLLSGLFAILLQILSTRLGAVTGMDLSIQTRRLVLGLPLDASAPPPSFKTRNLRLRYWMLLVPLYVINEVAIIATELAELIGSAIALNLLFPALPLWAGVLITTADVFLILVMYRPHMGVRIFEALIGVLVMVVLVCFCVLLAQVRPNWGQVFYGYVPSSTVVTSHGLYVSISILGATIMPHSLVLGSHFATIDRLQGYETLEDEPPVGPRATRPPSLTSSKKVAFWRRLISAHVKVPEPVYGDQMPEQSPASLRSLRLTLSHSSWDIAICLVFFAITINSAILIVASAAFYYGHNNTGDTEVVGDLFQAFELLRDKTGKTPAILFAIALLTAGQSSSITVTLAGQIISEGFIQWRLTPFMRRVLTRSLAVIPSMVVACVSGRQGLDTMLVASQVALSMALPFVSFPLLVVTCSPKRMTRTILEERETLSFDTRPTDYGSVEPLAAQGSSELRAKPTRWQRCREMTNNMAAAFYGYIRYPRALCETDTGTQKHAFHNSPPVALLSWAVFCLIVIADIYVLYSTLKDPSNA